MNGEVSKRAWKGVRALTLRQALILPMSLVGNILLSRMLAPEAFGTFAVAMVSVSLAAQLTHGGLSAYLVQRDSEPAEHDLRLLFSYHLAMALAWAAVAWFAAPLVVAAFKLEASAATLIRGLALINVISAFKVVPSTMLERRLAYGVFAAAEVAQALAYQGIVLWLAYRGWGVNAFLGAYGASILIAAVWIGSAAPWRPGLGGSWSRLQPALRFMVPYQLSRIGEYASENAVAIIAGPLCGPQAVGYLNWARSLAALPTRVLAELMARINFPTLSRLKDDPQQAQELFRRILYLIVAIVGPVLMIGGTLLPEIVQIVYTDRWAGGIPSYGWFALAMTAEAIALQADAALKASGRTPTAAVLQLVTLGAYAILGAIGVWAFGYVGVAIAIGVVSTLMAIGWLHCIPGWGGLWLARGLIRPLVAASLGAIAILVLKPHFVPSFASLVQLSLAGWLVSLLTLGLLELPTLMQKAPRWAGLRR